MRPNEQFEKIELSTTKAGLRLYNSTSENIIFYSKHIDDISKWYAQLAKISTDFPAALKKEEYENLKMQLSLNGLLSISILDLSIIVRQAFISNIKSEQLFYIKQGYLIVHSTIKHYDKKLNRYFTILINTHHPELLNEFNTISSTLRKFKNSNKLYSEIKGIRDNIAGHIDEDFQKYYITITALDPEKAFKTISEFIFIVTALQVFTGKLIKLYQIKF